MTKKKTTTTIARDYGGTPLMTATNGPWKSIRIDRSKSISLTCTSYSRYFTPPINDLNFFQKLPPSMYVCKYACMYLFFSTSDNNSLFSFFFVFMFDFSGVVSSEPALANFISNL